MAHEEERAGTAEGVLQSRISRRNLVKGGAVLGGSIWVAPAIESFVYQAAAASATCPPPGAYGLSGLTILYTRSGDTTDIFWSFIGQGQTACSAGSISDDDSFTTKCGSTTLSVNTPSAGVLWGTQSPVPDPSGCPFTATAGGANVVASGVTVLAWIAHNGTFTGGTPLGPKGHFEVQCGAPGQNCPPVPFVGGG
jgi:hypothetical protein